LIFALCIQALVGHVREFAGIVSMSTSIWLVADWDCWIVNCEAHSWSSVTIELFANLAVLASGSSVVSGSRGSRVSLAVVEQTFSSIETSLLILDRFAFFDDILVVIEVWSMGTDVHFG
jgi:hypothetical protein